MFVCFQVERIYAFLFNLSLPLLIYSHQVVAGVVGIVTHLEAGGEIVQNITLAKVLLLRPPKVKIIQNLIKQ